jgi:hypothetical protein
MTTSSSHLSALIIDQDTLFNRLQAGHTLVTGSSRLARILHSTKDQEHQEHKNTDKKKEDERTRKEHGHPKRTRRTRTKENTREHGHPPNRKNTDIHH